MKGEDLIELVAPGSMLANAEPADLAALAARATTRQFRRGEVLLHQGDKGDGFYIITKGVARVSMIAANGREITLDFLERGAVVGEIAVLDGLERTATVNAVEPVSSLWLDRSALRAIIGERPDFAWHLLAHMAKRLRQANATIESDRAFASGPRLARCLVRLMAAGEDGGQLRLQLNQTDLGQFAGMSREQINRQLSVWDEQGVIARDHGRVRILEPNILLDIAEAGE